MARLARWRPPDRDGVAASCVVVTAGPWDTVAQFLTARLRPGIDWPARLRRGDVLDEQGRALPPDAPARPGRLVWYWRELPDEPRVPFELALLHHDADLVVVDKPHFLASVPGGPHLQETALVRTKRLIGLPELMPLHRLDRETAGLLMFSARPESRDAYHALLRDRRVHKVYEAVVPWRDDLVQPQVLRHRLIETKGARHLPVQVQPGEPNAETRIELLQRLPGPHAGPVEEAGDLTWIRLTPLTGRRHQLRVQLNAIGLPIVGDRIYPRLWPEPAPGAPPDHANPLQLLAREIAFTDPVTGVARHFVSRRRLARVPPG